MKSPNFGRLIAGPVGSGKTTACLFELFRKACEQEKADDGLRYTRFAIVRQTLKQLKDTVLKDVISWLDAVASYKVSDNTIYIECGDVRSEWLLIPLDDMEDQRRLLSMQLTGAWMSEAIEMDIGIVAPLSGRLGRYPSASLGGCTWYGLIADTNMPTEGSDWHAFMELNTPHDWDIFIQPGGLEPNAENLEWLLQTPETLKLGLEGHDLEIRRKLGRQYYERFVRMNPPDWCRRYVHAKYGSDPSGTAVYRETFIRKFHVAPEGIEPVKGKTLLIGQDFGRDPGSLICQLDHWGRLLVLEEVYAEDIGLENHIVRALRPALSQQRYMGLPVAIIGDPSGRSKSSIYEETTFDFMNRMGFHAFPAPTNDIDPRIRAVETFLMGQRSGGPAILIDGIRCPNIVQGMEGGYRYAKTKQGQRKPSPEKNKYSHLADDLQYVCLAAHSGMAQYVNAQIMPVRRPVTPKVNAAGWT